MSIIIDGYNLLHASGILGRGSGPGGLERSRRALLNFLAESLPAEELGRTTVVFDAKESPHGLPRQMDHRGLTVHFAAVYDDADSLIEELIRQDSAPKRLVVVSSDHRLHRAAHRRKATAVDSDAWFAQIVRQRRERQDARGRKATKPTALSSEELDFWLREFVDKPVRAPDDQIIGESSEPKIENPFPPGYADDVFDDER